MNIALRSAMATWLFIAMMPSAGARNGFWTYEKNEDPFSGDVHMVLLIDGPNNDLNTLSMFRCQDGTDVQIMFAPARKPHDDSADPAKANNRILAIIDNNPKITLTASVYTSPNEEHYGYVASGDDVTKLTLALLGVKERFALAAETNGQILATRTYAVNGAKEAIEKLIKGCGIENLQNAGKSRSDSRLKPNP